MSWFKREVKRLLRPTRVRASTAHWGWWFSADEENYSGPYRTRDEAIDAARDENCGEWHTVLGVGRFHLMEARQGPIRLAHYIDHDDVVETFCQAVDDEYGGEDGIDWDGQWSKKADRDLERWIRRVVMFWQWWHGVEVRTWCFTQTRNAEHYTWVEGF